MLNMLQQEPSVVNSMFYLLYAFTVVLPWLAILTVRNNHAANETKKMDIAIQLFEAYSALSCFLHPLLAYISLVASYALTLWDLEGQM